MRATLAALAAAIVLLVVAQQVVRATTGPLPLVSVFELHLLVLAGVLAVASLVGSLGTGRSGAWVRLVALVVLIAVVVRAGGELWSSPDPGTGDEVTVLSWNLEMESRPGVDAVAGILDIDADVVALQELTPTFAAAIEADETLRARYPYRVLQPVLGAGGLGLLARLPLVSRDQAPAVPILRAGLLLPDGRTAEVLDVHPTRPLYRTIGPIPVALNTKDRDEDVLEVRAAVDALEDPATALVVGDLNGTWSEPGLAPLHEGLTNAHEAAGTGPGFTWRLDQLEAFGFGVLRIDHVLTGAWLRPVATDVNCEAVGDHCRLLVTLEVVEPA
jgi:endonuclease/exonuclease/phosphatase (EEP) superfamily protein YafD